MSAVIATASAHRAMAIVQRLLAKGLSKAANVLSFLSSVQVFQGSVRRETATVPKDNAHPGSLITADRVQRANAPPETLRHVLPANMTRVLPVITSPALPVAMTMTSNPVPMRT
jgi:hypothetical protein